MSTLINDKAAKKAAKKAARLLETPEEKKQRKAAKKAKKLAKEDILSQPVISKVTELDEKEIKKKEKKEKKAKRKRSRGEVEEVDVLTSPNSTGSAERSSAAPTPEPVAKRTKSDTTGSFSTAKPIKLTTTTKTKTTTEPTLATDATPEEYRKHHSMELLGKNEESTGNYNCPPPVPSFEASPWDKQMKRKLIDTGFTAPTPIQAQCWPICQEGRDIISVARTGSGKTLGFLLPAFVKILTMEKRGVMGDGRNPRACSPLSIVLAPTRELAMQIGVEASNYGRTAGVRCVTVYGGDSKGKQIRSMERLAPQMIIATPGRLCDFCKMGVVNLSRVCVLILDEADRMLDMGFEPQLNEIQTYMPRQTMGKNCFQPHFYCSSLFLSFRPTSRPKP